MDQVFFFTPRGRNLIAGVYYANSASNHKEFNISFHISGKYCTNATGDDCKKAINQFQNNTETEVDMVSYFAYDVGAAGTNDSTTALHFDLNTTHAVNIYARFSGVPSKDVNDVTSSLSKITILSPKVGTWIIGVFVTDKTNITQLASLDVCHNNTAGVGCKVNVTSSSNLPNKFISTKITKANDTIVYAISNIKFKALYASLYDLGPGTKASIYASFNRVPYLSDKGIVGADISGCNNEYCTKVQSISSSDGYMIQDNGTWYITIVAGRDNNDLNFWFDNICPNNCSSRGTCNVNGDDYGICQCPPDSDGLMCTSNNMLIEYIILIIIAALVLVSALLGLIAWAYMRRRAQYVEVR